MVQRPYRCGGHRPGPRAGPATDDLERLHAGWGSRHYPDPQAVQARLAAIARQRRVGAYLRAEVDAAAVLARYKGQEVVERRYGAFKGPLAVAPLFVQSTGASRRWSP